MARVEGCWASVLDDCKGSLTGEHFIPVTVFSAPAGKKANRDTKGKRQITVQRAPDAPPYVRSIEDYKTKVLCEFHNNSSNVIDDEAGKFARRLDWWFEENHKREQKPRKKWTLEVRYVDGPLLERWFMKASITQAISHKMVIGSATTPVGHVPLELAQMVFGHRPVDHSLGLGLFVLSTVGDNHTSDERFSFITFTDRANAYVVGGVLTFRSLHFGVHFEAKPLRASFFQALPEFRAAIVLHPFQAMNTAHEGRDPPSLARPAERVGVAEEVDDAHARSGECGRRHDVLSDKQTCRRGIELAVTAQLEKATTTSSPDSVRRETGTSGAPKTSRLIAYTGLTSPKREDRMASRSARMHSTSQP